MWQGCAGSRGSLCTLMRASTSPSERSSVIASCISSRSFASSSGLARHLWRAFSILRCPPFELKRADEVERRMAADGIVEAVDVTADCARGFDPALEEGAPDEFGLEGLEEELCGKLGDGVRRAA